MSEFNELLAHLANAPANGKRATFGITFRFPDFKPGEKGDRYLMIEPGLRGDEVQRVLEAILIKESKSKVFMREGRKVHTYSKTGNYLGYYNIGSGEMYEV